MFRALREEGEHLLDRYRPCDVAHPSTPDVDVWERVELDVGRQQLPSDALGLEREDSALRDSLVVREAGVVSQRSWCEGIS